MLNRAAIWIYGTFFATIVATGLGAPIPEELPIVTAGVILGHTTADRDRSLELDVAVLAIDPGLSFPACVPWAGVQECTTRQPPEPQPIVPLKWYLMLPVLILGVVVGDGFLYGMGRLFGTRLIETKWVKRFLPDAKKQRIEEHFHRYGMWVLLFARLLPTIRSPIFIMAGVMKLPYRRFVVADSIYAIPGVSLLFFLGYWFGDRFRDVVDSAEKKVLAFRSILILLGLVAITLYLIWHFFRHPVATGDPKQEVPVIGGQFASRMKGPEPALESDPTVGFGQGSLPPGSGHATGTDVHGSRHGLDARDKAR